jgi:hypothetical protein
MIANLAPTQYWREKKKKKKTTTTCINGTNGIMWNNQRIQILKGRVMENEENFSSDANFVAFIFHIKVSC